MLETEHKSNKRPFSIDQPAKRQLTSKWDQPPSDKSREASKEIQTSTLKNITEPENRSPSSLFFAPDSKELTRLPQIMPYDNDEDDQELVSLFHKASLNNNTDIPVPKSNSGSAFKKYK